MSDSEYSVIKSDIINRFDLLTCFLGSQKNRLIETLIEMVLLRTHTICMVSEIRKLILDYFLLSRGLVL